MFFITGAKHIVALVIRKEIEIIVCGWLQCGEYGIHLRVGDGSRW